jgi:flagellar biosynthesis component FlhA
MKHLWFVFLTLLLFCSVSISQTSDTTKKADQSQEQIKNSEQKETQKQDREEAESVQQKIPLEGFIDANANGIDDRLEQKGNGKRKGQQQAKDRFIDTDGDGICDGKESAIGLKKLYRKHRGNPNNR